MQQSVPICYLPGNKITTIMMTTEMVIQVIGHYNMT